MTDVSTAHIPSDDAWLWNGQDWVSNPGTQSATASPPPPSGEPPTKMSKGKKVALASVGGVVALAVIGGVLGWTSTDANPDTSGHGPGTNEQRPEAKTPAQDPQSPNQEPAAPEAAPVISFSGEGMYAVGAEIKPGLYVSESDGFGYWERLKDATGEFESILANENPMGKAYVEISESDAYFSTTGMQDWTLVTEIKSGKQASEFPGDGMYLVGKDIQAGTYKSSGGGYWARLSGASGDTNTIITNDNSSGNTIATVKNGDFFQTNSNGDWSLLQ